MQPIRTLRFLKAKSILKELGLKEKEYFVAMVHRAENMDSKERLDRVLSSFSQIYKEFGFPMIFPAHPRTAKMIGKFSFKVPGGTILNAVKCRTLGNKYIKRFFHQ